MSVAAAGKALLLAWAVLLASTLAGCGPSTPVQKPPQRGQGSFVKPEDEPEKPFVESNVPIPDYPRDRDLVEFRLQGTTNNRFFIDSRSLSVGEDGVVRFVLSIRTPDGIDNVRFSGLRCADRTWKDYAFGRSDHTWSVVASPEWRPIQDLRLNDYQQTLYKDYFCASGVIWSGPSGDSKKLVRVLKNPPSVDTRMPSARPY